jgi:Mg-chelatase subunit ChlD
MKTYLFSLLFACFCSNLVAQSSYNLSLKVLDNQGKPMANTAVVFTETQTKATVAVQTDQTGTAKYSFKNGKFWQFDILQIKGYYDWQFERKEELSFNASRTVTYDYKHYLRVSRPVIDRSTLQLKVEKLNTSNTEKPNEKEAIAQVEVVQANKQPLQNFPVQLTCYALNKSFVALTDTKGIAYFKLPIANDYQIDIDGIDNFDYIDLPNKPYYTAWARIIYEPTKVNEKIKNDTILQYLTQEDKSSSARVLSTLQVKGGENGNPANTMVYLQAIKTKKVYVGQADTEGKVRFLLPKGDAYLINFRYQPQVDAFNLTRHRGIGYSNKTLHYAPLERLQFPERFVPTPDNLYLIGFQNFFEGQLPKPKEGETLLTHAKFYGQINSQSTQAVLQLGFSAEQPTISMQNKEALNISFVVDKSGSMWGDGRINSLKVALKLFVEKLRSFDIVSLTAFQEEGKVLIPAQKVGADKTNLLDQINLLEADGGTAIWSGLDLGYKELQKNYKAKKVNRLILLSDGYGSDNPVETIEKSKAYNNQGLELSAVGVGSDYNAALMTKLASQGGGLLELTQNAADISQIFADELASLIAPIAEDVKIEVFYNKQLLYAQLFGYPIDEKREGKIQLKLPKIYAGMADQLALVKFTLVNPTQSIENEPVTIVTKYFDIQTQQTVRHETKATLTWSAATGQVEYAMERQDKKLYGVAIINWALKNMAEAFAAQDYAKAKKSIDEVKEEVKKLFPKAEDQDINKLLNEIASYSEALSRVMANK